MKTDEKIKLITRNLEEVLTEEELRHLIETKTPLKHYIGFEISGPLHIGHFYQLLKVKDLQEAGAETVIWLADLHSAINDKLDGNLSTIRRMGEEYFIPAMKVLFECIGGDPEKLIFKFCSTTYGEHPEFWQTFLEMAKATSLARIQRSITIMGREQTETIDSAKMLYPLMQAADIFLLQTNIAQAGIDQRKVHVIAIDGANQVETNALKDAQGNKIKPVAIHTPILLGLNFEDGDGDNPPGLPLEADELAMRQKMSKSKADSSVSVHDQSQDIKRKVNGAFAREGFGDSSDNALLNWARHLIFYDEGSRLLVKRDDKWGGDTEYNSYEKLEQDYREKKLHPQDLKDAVAEWLILKLEPVRKYFEDPVRANSLEEIKKLSSKKN